MMMPLHALEDPDTRSALFPKPEVRGAFHHVHSTFMSSRFTFFTGLLPTSMRHNVSLLVWDRPSLVSLDDFPFKKKKKTHKNSHYVTLEIKCNFSMDRLTTTPESWSETACWGCTQVKSVSVAVVSH